MTKEEVIKILNKLQEENKERKLPLREEEWVAIYSATRHLNDDLQQSQKLNEAAEVYTECNFETASVTEEWLADEKITAFKAGAKWMIEHIIEYIKKCFTISKYHKTLYCIDLEAFKESI